MFLEVVATASNEEKEVWRMNKRRMKDKSIIFR